MVGFFNALDSDGRAKFKMEKGKLYRLQYTPSKARLNRSPNSRRLNGKIFLALVHDFKKVDDETAVVVEWKEAPIGFAQGIKDQVQEITESAFADYVVLPPAAAVNSDAVACAAAVNEP